MTHFSGPHVFMSDEEKIIFHVLKEDIKRFVAEKRKSRNQIFGIAGFSLLALIFSYFNTKIFPFAGIFILFLVFKIREFRAIRISKRINRLARIGLPIHEAEFEGKSVWIDRSGLLSPHRFQYPSMLPEHVESTNRIYHQVKELCSQFPIILSSGHVQKYKRDYDPAGFDDEVMLFGEEAKFVKHFDELENGIKDYQIFSVELPVLDKSSKIMQYFRELEPESGNSIVLLQPLSVQKIRDGLNGIGGVLQSTSKAKKKETLDIDDLISQLIGLIDRSTPRMDYVVQKSLRDVSGDNLKKMLQVLNYSAYNYYCPRCNQTILQKVKNMNFDHHGESDIHIDFPKNTRMMLVDAFKPEWECPLCRVRNSSHLALHKMYDELFEGVYRKLSEENAKDRQKIYDHINDEKRKFSEKAEVQFHDVYREQRTKVDQISSKVRTVTAEVNADELAVTQLMALLIKYERISGDLSAKIEKDISRIKREITQESEQNRRDLNQFIDSQKKEMEERNKFYMRLEREEKKEEFALLQRSVKAQETVAAVKMAEAERAGMLDQSWSNPMNLGKNISRSLAKFSAGISGKSELDLGKSLYSIENG